MQLKESQTMQNLAKAYAGECQARTRYEFMEYGARKQGYTALADLIDDVAYNEFHHARMLYTFIQTADETRPIENIEICSGYPFREKWDLQENLRLAAEDEGFEAERIYPAYAETARKEGFPDIAGLFENLIQVETCHRKLFQQLYTQMKDGTMYSKPKAIKWKCGDCGYEATSKQAWEQCPLCQAKQGAVLIPIEDEA